MKILSVKMHCFASNCYLVVSGSGNCAVIDPGMEPENIIAAIEENHLTPKMILLTHGRKKYSERFEFMSKKHSKNN